MKARIRQGNGDLVVEAGIRRKVPAIAKPLSAISAVAELLFFVFVTISTELVLHECGNGTVARFPAGTETTNRGDGHVNYGMARCSVGACKQSRRFATTTLLAGKR